MVDTLLMLSNSQRNTCRRLFGRVITGEIPVSETDENDVKAMLELLNILD